MNIQYIKAFSDNYIWAIQRAQACFVVDPGDAEPVNKFLQENNLVLEGILITHWHPDHIGGVKKLLKKYPDMKIYGPRSKKIKVLKQEVREGDVVNVLGKDFVVWETPGHTLDHIVYIHREQKTAFVGDVIFSAACGKVFEGTFKQMFTSVQRFLSLPDACNVYCAHEYTLSNLKYALEIEPENIALQKKYQEVEELREKGIPTVPTSIKLEKQINPFLRTAVLKKSRHQYANMSELEVFKQLRQEKDKRGINMHILKLLIALQYIFYKLRNRV